MNNENDVRQLVLGWMGTSWAVDRIENDVRRGGEKGAADVVFSWEKLRGFIEFKYVPGESWTGEAVRVGVTRDQVSFLQRHGAHCSGCFVIVGIGTNPPRVRAYGHVIADYLMSARSAKGLETFGTELRCAQDLRNFIRTIK